MATVRDVVKRSMRLLGAIAAGEAPSADEQADALSALTTMLDSWSLEGLIVYAKAREEFTLTASQSSYTFGTSGNFNSARPIRIEIATVKQVGSSIEIPIEIVTLAEWAGISDKTVTSNFPRRIYPEGTYPLETVNVWPVPSEGASLVLHSWKPLSTLASVDTTITFPPGYQRAIEYNLAVELAPEFGKSISPEILNTAIESKDNLKVINTKPEYLSCDPAVLSRSRAFNILTGE
jgi:hypothetical protein